MFVCVRSKCVSGVRVLVGMCMKDMFVCMRIMIQ